MEGGLHIHSYLCWTVLEHHRSFQVHVHVQYMHVCTCTCRNVKLGCAWILVLFHLRVSIFIRQNGKVSLADLQQSIPRTRLAIRTNLRPIPSLSSTTRSHSGSTCSGCTSFRFSSVRDVFLPSVVLWVWWVGGASTGAHCTLGALASPVNTV